MKFGIQIALPDFRHKGTSKCSSRPKLRLLFRLTKKSLAARLTPN